MKKLLVTAIGLTCAAAAMAYTITPSGSGGTSLGAGNSKGAAHTDMTNGAKIYCNSLIPKKTATVGGVTYKIFYSGTWWNASAPFTCF